MIFIKVWRVGNRNAQLFKSLTQRFGFEKRSSTCTPSSIYPQFFLHPTRSVSPDGISRSFFNIKELFCPLKLKGPEFYGVRSYSQQRMCKILINGLKVVFQRS
jgi:hypothetical protein